MAKLGKVGGEEDPLEEMEKKGAPEEVAVMKAPPKAPPKQEGEASKLIAAAIAKVQGGKTTVYTERAVAKLRAVQVLLRVG